MRMVTGEYAATRRPDVRVRGARRTRWARVAAAGLALLLALVGSVPPATALLYPQDQVATVAPGRLTVHRAATGTWRAGPVTVRTTRDRLTVHQAGRVIWSSDPGAAFVTGGQGRVGWTEDRGYFWPAVTYTHRFRHQTVRAVAVDRDRVVVTGDLLGTGRAAGYELTFSAGASGAVVADLTTTGGLDSVALVSGRSRGAGVHGFGEQFARFDLDGRLLPILAREQGVGRGAQPITLLADLTNNGAGGTDRMTYAARPSFVTDDVRGVRLDPALPESHAFAVADTRTSDRVGLEVWAPRLRAELTAAATPAALVGTQAAGTHRPALPAWADDGAVVGLQGGTAAVRRKLDRLLEADADVAAVWLQDWSGQRTTSFGERLWWTWQLDAERYPGWADLVADLRAAGIRTTTYVNPFLVDATAKGDPTIRNLWAEARDAGHLVTRADGSPYRLDQGGFDASLVDLTDPAAREWFAGVIAEEVLAHGVDGFMADFGEGLPMDGVLADGDAELRHNEWPSLWAQTVARACDLAGRPDCLTWFRSGSLGMEEHAALFWNGDQTVTYDAQDGLASALLGTFSAGVSGWPLVHSDIGGYTSIDAVVTDYVRPKDLLARWAEYAAFGVVMRTHEGNRPAQNRQVYDDPTSAAAFARMTRLFAALAPYRERVVAEATRTGMPAIRHGWLVHPGTAAARVDSQFFLGRDVLVAPVLRPNASSVRVTFPPGAWVHLLTGRRYAGGRPVTVPAPVGVPAGFVRADSTAAGLLLPRTHALGG